MLVKVAVSEGQRDNFFLEAVWHGCKRIFGLGHQVANGTLQSRQQKRRNRWGAPAAREASNEHRDAAPSAPAVGGEPKRKRRSRWEEPDQSKVLALPTVPKEITLPGGIKVSELKDILA